MFFKNYLVAIFLKFLLIGLYFGLVKIFCKAVINLSRRNIFVVNLISFVFWLAFGAMFAYLSVTLYNYSFCWFGLLGMFLGLFLVQFSIDFFFTNLVFLIYNKLRKNSKGRKEQWKITAK